MVRIFGKSVGMALTLNVRMQTPHPAMPNLIIPIEERDNLISYIMSLRVPRRRRASCITCGCRICMEHKSVPMSAAGQKRTSSLLPALYSGGLAEPSCEGVWQAAVSASG
jgi:hypothetical protein